MKITRTWAMPSRNTFAIKPIHDLIAPLVESSEVICDPFVNDSPFKSCCQYQNDIDPAIHCTSHADAFDFLCSIPDSCCDLVLFDPLYSTRQISECYKRHGLSVNMETTQASYWRKLRHEIARITKPGGICVSCSWNTGGIGKTLGFDIYEILLVPHGGWHNDTIIVLDRKNTLI